VFRVSIDRTPDASRCGGTAIVVTRSKKIEGNQLVAAVYATDDVEEIVGLAKQAPSEYQEALAGDMGPDRLNALAATALIELRAASVLARAVVPPHEDREAFCARMRGRAEVFVTDAERLIAECTAKSRGRPPGWWEDLCK
jgi:hypothetical protein